MLRDLFPTSGSINASYSLYWDIVMDWGMMQSLEKVAIPAEIVEKPADCTHVLLRPRLRFGLWISLVILVTGRYDFIMLYSPLAIPSSCSYNS
jgi:EXS family